MIKKYNDKIVVIKNFSFTDNCNVKDEFKPEIVLIGKKIREFRLSINISQQELAYRSDVDIRTIQRIENGEFSCGIDIFISIARSLHVSPKDFFKS